MTTLPRPLRFLPVLLPLAALAACVSADRRAPLPPAKVAVVAPRPPPKPAWQARRVVTDAVTVAGGRLHTVKSGETGIAIARAYGVEWNKVAAANGLSPPYVLEVGDRLLLPTAKQVAAMSVEDRARAFSLQIDDIITGGEPAAPRAPATKPTAAKAPARPAPLPLSRPAAVAPLPVLAGEAPRFAWPVDGRILSGFGAKPGGRFNDGVNLKASAGAPVRAAGDGVVAYAGDAIPGFGNLLLIKHAGGWVSAYGHNDTLLVARGTRIARGDIVARAGATGSVAEPQLHFELRKGRMPIDPAKVIGGR
jgi:murein DD-endopeptidase MepM/ murein hydrolase activator NlpD